MHIKLATGNCTVGTDGADVLEQIENLMMEQVSVPETMVNLSVILIRIPTIFFQINESV